MPLHTVKVGSRALPLSAANISVQGAVKDFKAQGIVGIAFNTSLHGLPTITRILTPCCAIWRDLDMWAQFQVCSRSTGGPVASHSNASVCKHPDRPLRPHRHSADGPAAPGVQALLRLAESGKGVIEALRLWQVSRSRASHLPMPSAHVMQSVAGLWPASDACGPRDLAAPSRQHTGLTTARCCALAQASAGSTPPTSMPGHDVGHTAKGSSGLVKHTMTDFFQLFFSGLATGSIYALAALGFTLLWQASGTINFAQGEFVMLPAFIMVIMLHNGMPLSA
jgi:hypothetical protein